MKRMKSNIFIAFILVLTMNIQVFPSIPVDGNKLVNTKIIADYKNLKPGMDFKLGIILTPEKKWHTYWQNPGDAGLPTTVDLILPDGIKAGDIIWEQPMKFPFAGMANFGYDSQSFLTIPVSISKDFKGNELKIEAKVSWLACNEECVPGSSDIELKLPVGQTEPEIDTQNQDIFNKSLEKHSINNSDITVKAVKTGDDIVELEIKLPEYLKNISKLEFFPIDSGYFDNGSEQVFTKNGCNVILKLKFDKYREKDPVRTYGILVSDEPLSKDLPNKSVFINVEIK